MKKSTNQNKTKKIINPSLSDAQIELLHYLVEYRALLAQYYDDCFYRLDGFLFMSNLFIDCAPNLAASIKSNFRIDLTAGTNMETDWHTDDSFNEYTIEYKGTVYPADLEPGTFEYWTKRNAALKILCASLDIADANIQTLFCAVDAKYGTDFAGGDTSLLIGGRPPSYYKKYSVAKIYKDSVKVRFAK